MKRFEIKTRGHYDFVDITDKVAEILVHQKIQKGLAFIFVKGSTCALTTMEYEEGITHDIKTILEKLAPAEAAYRHHERWGDRNGAAHIKSALIGPDLLVPIEKGQLQLGTWQQIVLIDFDEKPRTREVIVTIIAENEA